MDLLRAVTPAQLDALRAHFQRRPVLTLPEFLEEGARALGLGTITPEGDSAEELRCEAAAVLVELFDRADRDRQGKISWNDLNNALMPALPDDELGTVSAAALMEQKSYRFYDLPRFPSHVPTDIGVITRVRTFPCLKIMVACLPNMNGVAIFRMLTDTEKASGGMSYLGTLLTSSPPDVDGGRVLDVTYIESTMLLVLVVSDFSLQFWDIIGITKRIQIAEAQASARESGGRIPVSVEEDIELPPGAGVGGATASLIPESRRGMHTILNGRGFQLVSAVHTPVPQHNALYVPETGKLLTSAITGDIHIWHVHGLRLDWDKVDVNVKARGMLRVHTSNVTEMVLMPDIGLVASCGMDCSIALWGVHGMADGMGGRRGVHDRVNMDVYRTPGQTASGFFMRQHFTGIHKRGVRCMMYMQSVRVLVAAGHENTIQTYDLLTGDATISYVMAGHKRSVICFTSLEPWDQHLVMPTPGSADDGSEVVLKNMEAVGRNGPVHVAHFVSLDEGGELRWWTLSRNASVLDDERCLQVLTPPMGTRVHNPDHLPRVVVNVRITSYGAHFGKTGQRPLILSEYAKSLFGKKEARTAAATTDTESARKRDTSGVHTGAGARGGGEEDSTDAPKERGGVVLSLGHTWTVFEAMSLAATRAPVAAMVYHAATNHIVAFSGRDARRFDAATGELVSTMKNALPAPVADKCAVLGGGGHKILVGCVDGSLVVLDAFTSVIARSLAPHATDVTALAYNEQHGMLISTAVDGSLFIHNEQGLASSEHMDSVGTDRPDRRARLHVIRVIRNTNGRGSQLACVAYSPCLGMMATGDGMGCVRVWGFERLTLVATLVGHDAEVTCMQFVPDHPVLVTADSRGVVNMWVLTADGCVESLCCLCIRDGRAVPIHMRTASASGTRAHTGEAGVLARMLPARATSRPSANANMLFGSGSGTHSRVGTPARRGESARGSAASGSAASAVTSPPGSAGTPHRHSVSSARGPSQSSPRATPMGLESRSHSGAASMPSQLSDAAVTPSPRAADACRSRSGSPHGSPPNSARAQAHARGGRAHGAAADSLNSTRSPEPRVVSSPVKTRETAIDRAVPKVTDNGAKITAPAELRLESIVPMAPVMTGSPIRSLEVLLSKADGKRVSSYALLVGDHQGYLSWWDVSPFFDVHTAESAIPLDLRRMAQPIPPTAWPSARKSYNPCRVIRRSGARLDPSSIRYGVNAEGWSGSDDEEVPSSPSPRSVQRDMKTSSDAGCWGSVANRELPPAADRLAPRAGGTPPPIRPPIARTVANYEVERQRVYEHVVNSSAQAQGLGDQVVCTSVVRTHGEYQLIPLFDEADLEQSAVAGTMLAAQRASMTREEWRGSPVQCMCHVHGLDGMSAVVTAGDDSKMCLFTYAGKFMGRIGAASGKEYEVSLAAATAPAAAAVASTSTPQRRGSSFGTIARGSPSRPEVLLCSDGAYLVDHKAECWHPGFSTGSRGGNYLAALAADVIRTLRAQKQAAQRFERAHQALTGGSTPRATSARSGSLVRTLLALPQPSSSPGRNVHTPLATATTSVLLPSSASRSRGSSRNSSRGFSLASTSRLLPSHEETMQPGHAMAQLLRHKERNHSSFAKREEERQRNDAAAASGSDTLLQQLMNTLAETPSTSRPATRGLHAVLKGRTLPQTPRAESFDEPSLSDSLVSIPSFALRVAAGDTARRNGGGVDPAAACPRTPVRLERLTHAASARSEQIDSFVEACHDYFTHEEGAEEESVLASPSPFVSVGTHTPRMDDDERLPPVRVPPATTRSRAESVASQAPMSDDGVVVAGAGAGATTSGSNKKPRLLSFLQKTQERAGQAPPTPAIMAALSDDTVSGAPVTTAETRMYQLAKYEELSRSLSKVSVQAILRERNPQLMAMLAYYKDRKRVGGNYRSMDKEELQRRAAGERSAGFDAETQDEERREERLVRTMALGVIAELARTAQERGSAVLGKEVPPHSRSSSAASSAPGTASDRRGAQRAADAGECFAPPHADAQGGTLLAAAETGKQPMLESGHTTDVIKSQLDREATAMKAASIWTRKTLSRSRSRVPAALTAEKADGILAVDEVRSRVTEPDAIALQFRAAAEEAARVQAQRMQAVAALRAAARGEKPAALVRKEEEEARARAACAPHMPLSEVQLRSHAKRLQPLVPSPAVAASTTAQRSAAARRSPGKTGAAPAGSPPIKQGALRRHVARGSGVLAASMEAARVPVLTPEEYLTLCKRAKIGNELKRDVQAFADLYKLVDPECTGTITFDKFMSAMDKGNVSLAYMKRQMEVLFRSADKEGTGTLAVADFARVIFPRAEHHNLNEILAYTTYAGPSAERIRAEYIKRNPEALELLRDLFNAYDADGSGSIDRSELKNAFAAVRGMYTKKSSEYMSADKLSEDTIDIMANVDASGDGEISFEEFVVLVGPHLVDGE